MQAVQWAEIECPYCGETFDTRIDPTQEFASYVENCQVCCKPMHISVDSDEGEFYVSANRC